MRNTLEGISNGLDCSEKSPRDVHQTNQYTDQYPKQQPLSDDQRIPQQEHIEKTDSNAVLAWQ